ncbi:class I SAM-dependent methyltransferase [Candidatus Peregrinibacteria bacterium]|nr:class I SAM-dependent methyltransferase [Candidatus Peregrinibacteria bacterium]
MHPPHTKDQSASFYNHYWQHVEGSYGLYPTIRHRKRFITARLRSLHPSGSFTLYDFGCGDGRLLRDLRNTFSLPPANIGGSDVADEAVRSTRAVTGSASVHRGAFPDIPDRYDAMVCSEVIEHTERYRDILAWIYEHLAPGGSLILTTQAGRIHASDRYTGHTQHFRLADVVAILRSLGYHIDYVRAWGFPFFTLQKYLTNMRFDHIQKTYMEGTPSLRKRVVFAVAYLLYFLHDLIPLGPQLYLVARRQARTPSTTP